MRNLKLQLKKSAIRSLRRLRGGFTYIELIIYLSIVTLMMATLIPFAWNVIEGGAKSSTEQEVFSQARYVSERLKYEIRNAVGINSLSATQVSLATLNPATNPTIISSSSGNITIQQGAASPIALNSKNTTIPNFTFTNYSSADNKTRNIQYAFTVAANYPGAGSRQEYNASTTIEGDAEVRSNTSILTPTPTPTNTPTPTPPNTPTPTPTSGPNLITNPGFESTGSWSLKVTSPSNGSYTRDCTISHSGSCSGKVIVTAIGNPVTDYWEVQLGSNDFTITSGKTYTLTFWARANAARPINFNVHSDVSPFTNYTPSSPTVTITAANTWQMFSYTFTSPATDSNAILWLEAAQATGTVWFDDGSF